MSEKTLEELLQQQRELEAAFVGLEKLFVAAKTSFHSRMQTLCHAIDNSHKSESNSLAKMTEALAAIIDEDANQK